MYGSIFRFQPLPGKEQELEALMTAEERQDEQRLRAAGWVVSQSEMGYRPKEKAALSPEQRSAHEDFLERIDDHDDCHRIYSA